MAIVNIVPFCEFLVRLANTVEVRFEEDEKVEPFFLDSTAN